MRHPLSYYDRHDPMTDSAGIAHITKAVQAGVFDALKTLAGQQGGVVVISNLTVNVQVQANSAHGGGATVNVKG